MMGIEPMASSLPRKRSTPELHRLVNSDKKFLIEISYYSVILSGRRDSNPRPSAWKADALPTELLPQNHFNAVGRAGFEPTKA